MNSQPSRPEREAERQVLAMIEHRMGRNARVSILQIAEATGLSERRIKGIVKDLVEVYGWRIGSIRQAGHGGYFVIADATDVEVATRSFLAEMRSLGRRVQVLKQISARDLVATLHKQLDLFDQPEEEQSA